MTFLSICLFILAFFMLIGFVSIYQQSKSSKSNQDHKKLIWPLIFLFVIFFLLGYWAWPTGDKSEPKMVDVKREIEIPNFSIIDEYKNQYVSKLYVQIDKRLNLGELNKIASHIRKDSSDVKELYINFLLPGNRSDVNGGINAYASCTYPTTEELKKKNFVKDLNNIPFEMEMWGITPIESKKLLSVEPPNAKTKKIIGKFIDDYTHTVRILYNDKLEKPDKIFVVEMDTSSKVISAVMPFKDGQKYIISKSGDFFTLKDSTLTLYEADNIEHPYRSIKSGI